MYVRKPEGSPRLNGKGGEYYAYSLDHARNGGNICPCSGRKQHVRTSRSGKLFRPRLLFRVYHTLQLSSDQECRPDKGRCSFHSATEFCCLLQPSPPQSQAASGGESFQASRFHRRAIPSTVRGHPTDEIVFQPGKDYPRLWRLRLRKFSCHFFPKRSGEKLIRRQVLRLSEQAFRRQSACAGSKALSLWKRKGEMPLYGIPLNCISYWLRERTVRN